ncbi:MAG: hypothetical protein AAF403_03830 [Pseudomonadota bacterium]
MKPLSTKEKIGRIFFITGTIFIFSGVAILALNLGNELLGAFWYRHAPHSLGLFQTIIQRYIWADLWDFVFVPLLTMPIDFLIISTGAILLITARFLKR